MADIFLSEDVTKLFHNKFVVVIGDSGNIVAPNNTMLSNDAVAEVSDCATKMLLLYFVSTITMWTYNTRNVKLLLNYWHDTQDFY